MVSFTNKEIADDGGLPRILTEGRQASKLTLEKLEKLTLVPKKYLLALEEGRYWDLPGDIYGRQFLKAYVKFLGISYDLVAEKFNREFLVHQNSRGRAVKPKEPEKPSPRLIIGPSIFKKVLVFLVIACFFSYIGWEIKNIITPPALSVDSPSNDLVTSRQVVEIKGWVEPESKLLINGQEVYSDHDGNFLEDLGLQPGVNLITFSAKKKHSQETVLVRTVMVKSDQDPNQISAN